AFLASASCAPMQQSLRTAALNSGAQFAKNGPFRMDQYAEDARQGGSKASSIETTLAKTIPTLLSENPLSSSQMLPLMGQLALLSPQASRQVLTSLIRQETLDADKKLTTAKADLKPAIASELAASLLSLGVLEPVVAGDLSDAISEMALTSQGDSLGRFFRGLAAAAGAEPTLAPTFNLSASALNQGVQKGKVVLGSGQQESLLRAVFEALRASIGSSGLLEPGAAELNEALDTLVSGKPILLTSLRKLWREAVRVLSKTTNQGALASAVAGSLNPQMVFLRADLRELLLAAGANYPQVATAIQQNIADAWSEGWTRLAENKIQVADFNRLKGTYFEPWVDRVLDFPPGTVQANWLTAVIQWGLVSDAQVEKKMPRLFVGVLERRDRALASAAGKDTPENAMQLLSEGLGTTWALHHAYLPALNRWVKKNED
ncbi:hypothetical protein K2X33_14960, partial [bacterium]|nr:hypothetical protein [bacterium]